MWRVDSDGTDLKHGAAPRSIAGSCRLVENEGRGARSRAPRQWSESPRTDELANTAAKGDMPLDRYSRAGRTTLRQQCPRVTSSGPIGTNCANVRRGRTVNNPIRCCCPTRCRREQKCLARGPNSGPMPYRICWLQGRVAGDPGPILRGSSRVYLSSAWQLARYMGVDLAAHKYLRGGGYETHAFHTYETAFVFHTPVSYPCFTPCFIPLFHTPVSCPVHTLVSYPRLIPLCGADWFHVAYVLEVRSCARRVVSHICPPERVPYPCFIPLFHTPVPYPCFIPFFAPVS